MFMKHKPSGDLIEILNTQVLFDPCQEKVLGQFHAGEEMQDAQLFDKNNLCFPSGETLPACWLEPDYRHEVEPA